MQEKISLKTAEEEYKELCTNFMSELCTPGHKNLYRDKKLYIKARMEAALPRKRTVILVALLFLCCFLSIVLLFLSLNFSLPMNGWLRVLGVVTGGATMYFINKMADLVDDIIEKDKKAKALELYLKYEFDKKTSEFFVSHLTNMKWEEVKEFVSIKKHINREMFLKIEIYAIMESHKDAFDEIEKA